ncbi:hypothetical protein [Yinghuangia soli]|uniref:Uncharacterized protein n=1 Tax=Yinghuangia soli TaxID=2908204 RepID=A0AA41Q496_9ACTN|nr:hypothetical protein [Yinghuangia soli]MCF2531273.1 hypothetical protein [Yinghuangia soli]
MDSSVERRPAGAVYDNVLLGAPLDHDDLVVPGQRPQTATADPDAEASGPADPAPGVPRPVDPPAWTSVEYRPWGPASLGAG